MPILALEAALLNRYVEPMKWLEGGWGLFVRAMTGVLLLVVMAGCATGPQIDWNGRIGNYTFDQSVMELGPPDKIAALTDGTRVAEWLTSRGYSHGYVTSFGPHFYHPYFYGPPAYYYSDPPSPDRFLRLTFAPDGRLLSWRRVYR
jgi:hypothetical protein